MTEAFKPGDIVVPARDVMPTWQGVRMLVMDEYDPRSYGYEVRALDRRPDRDDILETRRTTRPWDPQDSIMFWPAEHLRLHTAGPGFLDPAVLAQQQVDWWCRVHDRTFGECTGRDDLIVPCAAAPPNY